MTVMESMVTGDARCTHQTLWSTGGTSPKRSLWACPKGYQLLEAVLVQEEEADSQGQSESIDGRPIMQKLTRRLLTEEWNT